MAGYPDGAGPSADILQFILNAYYGSISFEFCCELARNSTVNFTQINGVFKKVRQCEIHFNCLSQKDLDMVKLYCKDDIDEPSVSYYRSLPVERASKLADDPKQYGRYIQALLTAISRPPYIEIPWVTRVQLPNALSVKDCVFLTSIRSSNLFYTLQLKYG